MCAPAHKHIYTHIHTDTHILAHNIHTHTNTNRERVNKVFTKCRKFYTQYKRNKLSRVIPKEGKEVF